MVLLVDLEVPPETPPALVQALLGGCRSALGTDGCELTDVARAPTPRWHARIVLVPGEPEYSLRVEVRRTADVADPAAPPPSVERRELHFKATDAPRARWEAAGLTVAAAIEERDAPKRPAPVVAKPKPKAEPRLLPKPKPAAPPKQAAAVRERPRTLGVFALAGPGLSEGPWRFGLRGEGRQPFALGPLLLAGAIGIRFEQATHAAVSSRWSTLDVGGLVELVQLAQRSRLELGLAFAAQTFTAVAERDGLQSGRQASRFGGRTQLLLVHELSRTFSAVAGAEAEWLGPPVEVRLAADPVGRDAGVHLGLTLGVRAAP